MDHEILALVHEPKYLLQVYPFQGIQAVMAMAIHGSSGVEKAFHRLSLPFSMIIAEGKGD